MGVQGLRSSVRSEKPPWTKFPSKNLEKPSIETLEQNNTSSDSESMPERHAQRANQNSILLQNELKVIQKMVEWPKSESEN